MTGKSRHAVLQRRVCRDQMVSPAAVCCLRPSAELEQMAGQMCEIKSQRINKRLTTLRRIGERSLVREAMTDRKKVDRWGSLAVSLMWGPLDPHLPALGSTRENITTINSIFKLCPLKNMTLMKLQHTVS